jgi:hypothetical protein
MIESTKTTLTAATLMERLEDRQGNRLLWTMADRHSSPLRHLVRFLQLGSKAQLVSA